MRLNFPTTAKGGLYLVAEMINSAVNVICFFAIVWGVCLWLALAVYMLVLDYVPPVEFYGFTLREIALAFAATGVLLAVTEGIEAHIRKNWWKHNRGIPFD